MAMIRAFSSGWQLAADLLGRQRVGLQDAVDHLAGGFGPEGLGAGQHFIEDDARRVNVAGRGRCAVADPFGRQVADGAHDHARHGQPRLGRGDGQAEIEQLGEVRPALPLADHDVLRLQIAVHDALGVGWPAGRR